MKKCYNKDISCYTFIRCVGRKEKKRLQEKKS